MADENRHSRFARRLPEGIRSKYELVVAAAKEAERLNEEYRNRGLELPEKVTMLALKRVEKGLSKVVHEEANKQTEEEKRRETTYFFGS